MTTISSIYETTGENEITFYLISGATIVVNGDANSVMGNILMDGRINDPLNEADWNILIKEITANLSPMTGNFTMTTPGSTFITSLDSVDIVCDGVTLRNIDQVIDAGSI